MKDELFEELCSGHVLGSLSPEDEALWQKALAQATPEQEKFFQETLWASEHLSVLVEQASPASDVKAQLLDKIGAGEKKTSFLAEIQKTFEEFKSNTRYAIRMALALLTFSAVLYGAQNCGSGTDRVDSKTEAH